MHIGEDGELLQGSNYICNNGLVVTAKKLLPRVPITVVTLTHPYPLVTFRLKPFLFWHLTRVGTLGGLAPEVT